MTERNLTICKLCQKALADDEASKHYCAVWCSDEEENNLQAKDIKG